MIDQSTKETIQSNVIPFFAEPKRERACSFCKRKESEVAKMVSNTNESRSICGDCVAHAKKRLTDAAEQGGAA